MKNPFKLNNNLPPLNLPLEGGEQKRGVFKDHNSKSAFTLVELAIVIVVLGILASAVVGGQNIIDSVKRNKFGSEIEKIRTGYTFFKFEYGELPGDFDEATNYWPNGNSADGDADKIIEGSGWTGGGNTYEAYCFWNHLYNSEILPYKQVDCTATYPCCGPYEESAATSNAYNDIFLMFSTQFAPSNKRGYLAMVKKGFVNNSAGLLVRDLYKIDKKFDDGLRTSGMIVADHNGYVGSTATSSVCGNNGTPNGYIIDNANSDITRCRWQRFYLDWEAPRQ